MPRALRRPRLVEQLDHAAAGSLTLVSAPPGTGKTTLVSDWVKSRSDLHLLWLDLDRRANDNGWLSAHLERPLCDRGLLSGSKPDRPRALLDLVDELSAAPAPAQEVVIVLDDAHELLDRGVWSGLDRLVATAPPWLHWIVVTRADPPLSLRRLQLHGRLEQVRAADLAFDTAEAEALFSWLGLDIPFETMAELVRWSEGWVAALCLAAQTLTSGNPDGDQPWARGHAGESLVMDFLVEEVVDRLTPFDRRFLLRSSVADVLSAELAVLLTGNVLARKQLHRLERAGTFLVSVDASGDHFRYHGLMATLLRARLNDEEPALAKELAGLTARWYADNGFEDEAERHGVRAGDWALVGQLRLRKFAAQLVETGLVAGSRPAVPPSASAADPSLALVLAVDALRRNDRRSATAMVGANAAAGADPTLARALIDVELARWTGEDRDQARLDTPPAIGWTGVDQPHLDAYLLLRDGERHLARGREESARRCFEAVISGESPRWAVEQATILFAMTDATEGRTARLAEFVRNYRGDQSSDAAMWMQLGAGLLHGLRGELSGVRHRTDAIDPSAAPRSELFRQCTDVLLASRSNRTSLSVPSMTPLEGWARSFAISLGILEYADRDGRVHGVGGSLEAAIVHARRAVAESSLMTARDALAPWFADGFAGAHPCSVVEALVLRAIIESRHANEGVAVELVERAVEVAGPGQLWGPVVAWEAELKDLMLRNAWELGSKNADFIEVFDIMRASEPAATEALTERERVVLHYLPTLMSNAEIAAEMVVSVNTVKTHLKSIYRKLGVERRRDALLRARQVELL